MERIDYFQWFRALKRRHPDALLLILQRDYYETYAEDAEALAKTCRQRLHDRGDGPLTGFPKDSLVHYRKRLEAAGYRVVLAKVTETGFWAVDPPEEIVEPEPPAPRRRAKKTKPAAPTLIQGELF